MCHGIVEFEDYSTAYNINFKQFFSNELENLQPMEKNGLVVIGDNNLTVTEAGRMFIRSIAMEFDEYLSKGTNRQRFSKVI